MIRNDNTFKTLVKRLQNNELTRRQAADIYKINYGTLCTWLCRSDLGKSTRQPYTRRSALARSWPTPDPTLLQEAAEKVLKGEIRSCLAACKIYPTLNPRTLARKVQQMR